jgi:hypothetical protein
MSIFTSLLQKTSSVKNICILFIISHLVLLSMMLFTFPVINHQIGTKAFDLQPFGYSVSVAKSIVNNLNDYTTQMYLFPQLTFLDVLYPFLLALFLSSLLWRLVHRNTPLGRGLLIIPFLAMTFDYLENACVILMISKSVTLSESIVLISSLFTVLKGVLTSIAWLAILMYAAKWCILRIKKKKNKQAITKLKPNYNTVEPKRCLKAKNQHYDNV